MEKTDIEIQKEDIKNALQVLQNGGIILYPTDTIWGIGCDASNQNAVKRIYDLKKRNDTKSMLVLLDNAAYLSSYVSIVPEVAYELIEVTDKPLTIIYPGAKNMAPNLISEDGSIGIRIPDNMFCKQLIGKLKKPLVSTSANISGQQSPSNFSEITDEVKKGVDYIVKWQQTDFNKNLPSSILKLGINGEIKIIRK